jgi:hypothetical protein
VTRETPTVDLLHSDEMGRTPKSFYIVAKAPGALAGMSYPHGIDWHTLHDQGFRYVVCLTDAKPPYDPAPLGMLFSADMQDLAGGAYPRKPEYEENCVRSAVALIIPRLRADEGVVVHCVGGTGRTGTVLACTLKALGLTVQAVLDQMRRANRTRAKYPGWEGWPESQWQQTLLDRF